MLCTWEVLNFFTAIVPHSAIKMKKVKNTGKQLK